MSLPGLFSVRARIILIAMCFALALPTAASARFFFWWWLRPPAPPVQDVTFLDVTSTNSKLADVYFLNNQFDDFELYRLQTQTLTAQVTSQQITIAPFSLTDGAGTTADVTVSAANLVTDVFGSSFRADATIDVVTPTSSFTINGQLFGRVSEKSDNYNLRASIGGVSPEDLGGGSIVYHLARVYLSGSAAVPAAP